MFQQTAGPIPCAMCRQLVVKFCRNIFANKVLATIQGKCLVCNNEFDLGTAKDHVKHCPQMEMTCSLCKETIKRIDQLVHANACPMKEITCACGEIFPQKNLDEHKELSCSFKRIDCPLNCQDSVQRYLLPSHTLKCTAVVNQCPTKGCGARVRRCNLLAHLEENKDRHYSLLLEEKKNILWEVNEVPWSKVISKRTGQVGVFKWTISSTPTNNQVICSPPFQKLDISWRLVCTKRGDRSEYALEYTQGVSSIHLALSFVVEHQGGSRHVHNIPHVKLKEGEQVFIMKRGTPHSLTAKIELLEPALA
ncbi:PREDICTED: TNF receptor-associated factor family protein DDB_G0277243-like [Acropora digitifera]|uniref:TNF receptor-associated factor family protein DDB_G0277243-like n=1 Tax=Acropora digitifera TaxID=70779 RepID=UPI000779F37D|nr:PREDICTED: TNF receptor-associated factor family protein DDB_G0277243-like [Acropora digitifera]